MVVGAKHKTLDLVADSAESSEAWVMALRHLKKKLAQADLQTQQEVYPYHNIL